MLNIGILAIQIGSLSLRNYTMLIFLYRRFIGVLNNVENIGVAI